MKCRDVLLRGLIFALLWAAMLVAGTAFTAEIYTFGTRSNGSKFVQRVDRIEKQDDKASARDDDKKRSESGGTDRKKVPPRQVPPDPRAMDILSKPI